MTTNTDLQNPASIVVSLLTAIGSISFLDAAGIVVGIVCTIAVAVSTIKKNRAIINNAERHGRSNDIH